MSSPCPAAVSPRGICFNAKSSSPPYHSSEWNNQLMLLPVGTCSYATQVRVGFGLGTVVACQRARHRLCTLVSPQYGIHGTQATASPRLLWRAQTCWTPPRRCPCSPLLSRGAGRSYGRVDIGCRGHLHGRGGTIWHRQWQPRCPCHSAPSQCRPGATRQSLAHDGGLDGPPSHFLCQTTLLPARQMPWRKLFKEENGEKRSDAVLLDI